MDVGWPRICHNQALSAPQNMVQGWSVRLPPKPAGPRRLQGVASLNMPKEELSLKELRRLAPAAAMNARELLTDAEILAERERWARAHGLAILASEEAGKAHKCMSFVIGVPK